MRRLLQLRTRNLNPVPNQLLQLQRRNLTLQVKSDYSLLKQKQKEAAAAAEAEEAAKKKRSGFSFAKMIANEIVFACTPANYYEHNIDEFDEDLD